MIDIEALAAPAFLIEVTGRGALAEARLNAMGRAQPSLAHALSHRPGCEEPSSGRAEVSLWPLLASCAARRLNRDVTLTAPTPDGSPVWRASVIPMNRHGGRVTALLGICHEDRMSGHGHPRGDHLSLALRAIHGAEWRYDVRRDLYEGSNEIAMLIGEDAPRPVTWAEWLERVHPLDLTCFLGRPDLEGTAEFRFRAIDGHTRWARCSKAALTDETGIVEAVLGIMVDITEERIREKAWAELAAHDPLTGLLNRRGLRKAIQGLLADTRPRPCLAVLAVDLDRFKETNDAHGHAAGDAVLVEASRRLTATMPCAPCARLGGDEFVAVLPVSGAAEAQEIRTRLLRAFRRPLAFHGRWLPVSASVGVACGPITVDIARLMDDADADLYARKRARNRYQAAAA